MALSCSTRKNPHVWNDWKRFACNPDTSSKVSMAALLVTLLFVSVEVKCGTYIALVALITLTLWSCFSFCKNIGFYLYYVWILILSEVALYVQNGLSLPLWLSTVMLLVVGGVLFLLGRHLYCFKESGAIKEDVGFDNLFRERERDLERLTRYLEDFKVLGVNSFWGDGKTYLYEMFRMRNEASYYYISISVMTLQLDSVEKFLVSEIARILEQNKIYSAASAKLATFFHGDMFLGFGRFFTSNNSYTESLQTLMADINKLDRPLFITFEDIDRISDRTIAQKVFAISEMLTRWTTRVRILFQYDRSMLGRMFEKEPENYIEKYIPYTIALTPISFGRCLKVLLKNGRDKGSFSHINEKDFYIITSEAHIGSWLEAAGINDIGSEVTLTPKWYSIRSVELFIKEVEILMAEDASYDKKVVVLLLFAKHFLSSEIFNVNLSEGIYDNSIFSFEGASCKIQRILAELRGVEDPERRRELYAKTFAADSANLYYLLLMNKLGYKLLKVKEISSPSNVRERVSGILNEKAVDIRDKDYNEKLDRLVRRVYAMGRSDRTDLENAVMELEKVLDLNGSERDSAFREFLNKAYYQDFERVDNATIFMLGIPQFLPIFRSFLLYERDSAYWVKLLDFYFYYCNVTGITADLVQCLNYCRIDFRDVFLDVVKRFNRLEIKGNLKKTKSYPIFLAKYVQEIINLTGIREYNFELLVESGEADSRIIDKFKCIADGIKSQLRKLQREVGFSVVKDDCTMLRDFLDKNNSLINSTSSLKEFERNSSIHTEIFSPVRDVENQIKKANLNGEPLKDLLIDNYIHGNLNATDVQLLWDRYSGA